MSETLNLARTNNSQDHSAKGTPSHLTGLLRPLCSDCLRVVRFQVLFHSPPGVLFTFPSRYWFTIGLSEVFSLARWSSRIPTDFHLFRGTWERSSESRRRFAYRTFTFCGSPFQRIQLPLRFFTLRAPRKLVYERPTTPTAQRLRPLMCCVV